jgi:hypothetical protein
VVEWRYSSTILKLGMPLPLYPRGNSPWHPRADLDVMEKNKVHFLNRESNPDFSVGQPVA